MLRRRSIEDEIERICYTIIKKKGEDAIDEYFYCKTVLSERAMGRISYDDALLLLSKAFDRLKDAKKALDEFESRRRRRGSII